MSSVDTEIGNYVRLGFGKSTSSEFRGAWVRSWRKLSRANDSNLPPTIGTDAFTSPPKTCTEPDPVARSSVGPPMEIGAPLISANHFPSRATVFAAGSQT